MAGNNIRIVPDRHGLWLTQGERPVSLVREPGRFVYYAPGEQYDGLVYCYENQDNITIEER